MRFKLSLKCTIPVGPYFYTILEVHYRNSNPLSDAIVTARLEKVAVVARTELQDLGSGSQPQYMPPNLSRAGSTVQTAPASFRGCLLLLIYMLPFYLSIFCKCIYSLSSI